MSLKIGFIFIFLLDFSRCHPAQVKKVIQSENFRPEPQPQQVVTLENNTFRSQERSGSNRPCKIEVQLYHNETKRCYYPSYFPNQDNYDVPHPSPCGPLQEFVRVPNGYGECACVQDENGCHGDIIGVLKRPVLNGPGSSNKNCYYAFDQGPCESGKWLVVNPITNLTECKRNPCLGRAPEKLVQGIQIVPKSPFEIFWFQKENDSSCYQTFTQAYCQPGQFVIFAGTNRKPTCVSSNIDKLPNCYSRGSAQTSAQMDCAEGLKKLADGRCVESVGID